MKYDQMLLIVEPSMSDADLWRIIRRASRLALEQRKGFFLFVSGFDDDPRSMFEIPEAMAILDRVADRGGMTPLACNIPYGPEFVPEAIGSFQLWQFKTRQQALVLNLETMDRFERALCESNNFLGDGEGD